MIHKPCLRSHLRRDHLVERRFPTSRPRRAEALVAQRGAERGQDPILVGALDGRQGRRVLRAQGLGTPIELGRLLGPALCPTGRRDALQARGEAGMVAAVP